MAYWSEQETDLLRSLWKRSTEQDLVEKFPGRSRHSLRRKAENLNLTRDRGIELDSRQVDLLPDWLVGEILSDGHFSRAYQYAHTTKYEEYVEFLTSKFDGMGLQSICWNDTRFEERTGNYYSRSVLKTRSYFKKQREIWYPEGEKEVPEDIILNDEIFKHFIMGDGSLGMSGNYFVLCVMGFSDRSIGLFKVLLENYGLSTVLGKDRNLTVEKNVKNLRRILRFLELVDGYPNCYLYKFERMKIWCDRVSVQWARLLRTSVELVRG